MKERRVYRGIVATVVAAMSLMLVTHAASAQVINPRLARGYSAWLTRAMDKCIPVVDFDDEPTVTVLWPLDVPPVGCLQRNLATDHSLKMNLGRIRINNRGRIGVFATGFTLGDSLRVRLKLRVTRIVTTPAVSVTFPDQTIYCPPVGSFLARASGAVAGVTDLVACLAPYGGLAASGANVEILEANLVNVDAGICVGGSNPGDDCAVPSDCTGGGTCTPKAVGAPGVIH